MNIRHVAIIMDGNGRWAKMRGLPRIEGHRNGVKKVNEIIDAAIEAGLEAVTFYTFSMENWNRPAALHEQNIVFRAIGKLDKLPAGVQKLLADFEGLTKNNTGLIVTTALSYGGREEIVTAVKRIAAKGMSVEDIDDSVVASNLYTVGIPDPDLIIRTSGEMRLSNFLLWQAAYAEFYFTDILWPDFGRDEFMSAVREFEGRDRRFGALSEKSEKS
jgi:undecaprenyl diphosphate synthase